MPLAATKLKIMHYTPIMDRIASLMSQANPISVTRNGMSLAICLLDPRNGSNLDYQTLQNIFMGVEEVLGGVEGLVLCQR